MVPVGGRGPIGQTRNIAMLIVLSVVTCGIYGFIQTVKMLNELKAYRGKDDFNPVVVLIVSLFISGFSYLVFGIPAKVTEAKQLAGIPNGAAAHPVLYFFLGPIFLAIDLNEVWAASGGGQPR
jgi:Domain of unknown function (DUF4234)